MSQTSLQVRFDKNTQTIDRPPSNILILLEILQEIYHNLPPTWRLHYQNGNKEVLQINSQQDYKEFLKNMKTLSPLIINIVPDLQHEEQFEPKELNVEEEENPDFFSEESFSLIEDDKNEADEIKSLSSSSQILNPENMNDQDSSEDFNVLEAQEKKSFEMLEYSIPNNDAPISTLSKPQEQHFSQDQNKSDLVVPAKEHIQSVVPQNLQAMDDYIDRSIARKLPEIAMLVKAYFENDKQQHSGRQVDESLELNKSIHSHYYCDNCGADPIIGVRYKCSVCPDFDICERCERTIQHPHLFLKINHPKDTEKLKNSNHNTYPRYTHQEIPKITIEEPSMESKIKEQNNYYYYDSEEEDEHCGENDSGDDEEEEESSEYEYEYEEEEEKEEGFNLKGFGKKLKETTLVKVLSGTYGQLPNAISSFFGSLKGSPPLSDDEENFSDEDEEEY